MQIQDFFIDLNHTNSAVEQKYDLESEFWSLFENSLIPKGKVAAVVSLEPQADFFELRILINGVVQIPCDRCLDDVDIRVERQDYFIVKLADADDYDDDTIYINRNDGMLDIASLIYEAAALSLPMEIKHPEGQCNPEMMEILKQHSVGNDIDSTDPRWEELQKFIQ